MYRAIEPVSARREGTGEEPLAESREGRVLDQVFWDWSYLCDKGDRYVKGIWREGCGRAPIKGRTRRAALGPLATLAVALRASTNMEDRDDSNAPPSLPLKL